MLNYVVFTGRDPHRRSRAVNSTNHMSLLNRPNQAAAQRRPEMNCRRITEQLRRIGYLMFDIKLKMLFLEQSFEHHRT